MNHTAPASIACDYMMASSASVRSLILADLRVLGLPIYLCLQGLLCVMKVICHSFCLAVFLFSRSQHYSMRWGH